MRQHSHSIPSIRLTITLYGRHIPSPELSYPSSSSSDPSLSLSLSLCPCPSLLPYPCQWWIVNVACSEARLKCQCRLRQGRCRAASIAHDMFIGHGAVIQPKWFRFRPCRPFCHMNECSPLCHTHIQTRIVAGSCLLRLLTIAPCAISFCFSPSRLSCFCCFRFPFHYICPPFVHCCIG